MAGFWSPATNAGNSWRHAPSHAGWKPIRTGANGALPSWSAAPTDWIRHYGRRRTLR